MLNCKLTDDDDIQRQVNCLYTRGNMLIKSFSYCTTDVKLQLFKTYFYSIYMCQLWCCFRKCTQNRIKVAYNNIFRSLMNIDRRESISAEYVSKNVHSFMSLERKYQYSCFKRVMQSTNVLISTIVSSSYFVHSSILFSHWNNNLFLY